MVEKLIDLDTPIKGHGKNHTQIRLREPTARDFLELGEPQSVIYGPNDAYTLSDNDSVIEAYLRRCIREPVADIVLAQIGLADAIRLRKGLLDFFTAAYAVATGKKPSSTATSADGPTPLS